MRLLAEFPMGCGRYRGWVLALLLPIVPACQGDHLERPSLVPDDVIYWHLELSHHAVTLSTTPPYDTLTVLATPRNLSDEVLAGPPRPQYRSTDPEHVAVTAEGVLHAVAPTSGGVAVTATLAYNNLKHVDTLWVAVVDEPNPPVLDSISIDPLPPDSAKSAALERLPLQGNGGDTGGLLPNDTLPVRAFAAGNVILPRPLTYFRAADTTVLVFHSSRIGSIPSGIVIARRYGTTKIYASTTLFGVTKTDTITYRVGRRLYATIDVARDPSNPLNLTCPSAACSHGFFPSEVTVATGGLVLWQDQSSPDGGMSPTSYSTGVVFDDPAGVHAPGESSFWPTVSGTLLDFCFVINCGAGNFIVDANDFGYAARVFLSPGIYTFHSVANGASGRVVVLDD